MESWILFANMKVKFFLAQKANFVPNCSYYENIEEWTGFNQFISSGSLISKTRFFVWSSHIGRMINRSKSIFCCATVLLGKLWCKIYLCRFCEENWVEIFQCIDILICDSGFSLFWFSFILIWCVNNI